MEHIATAMQKLGPPVQLSRSNVDQESTKSKRPSRPWIRERLGERDLDVERIVANWKADRRAAPTLAKAVRLMDAIERGDLAAVQQIAPLLVAAFSNRKKMRGSPSSYRSRSIKEGEREESEADREQRLADEAALNEIGQATLDATGGDWRTDAKVRNQIKAWAKTDYTASHVKAAKLWWRDQDWRGKKGDPFLFSNLCEIIGRMLQFDVENMDLDIEEISPYLAHEYWRRKRDGVVAPEELISYRDAGGPWERNEGP